jgi:hypothetical protein
VVIGRVPSFRGTRNRSTSATGVKENNGYEVYDELIDGYIAQGDPVEADWLASLPDPG